MVENESLTLFRWFLFLYIATVLYNQVIDLHTVNLRDKMVQSIALSLLRDQKLKHSEKKSEY